MAFKSRLVALVLSVLIVSMSTFDLAHAVPPKNVAAVEFFKKKIRSVLGLTASCARSDSAVGRLRDAGRDFRLTDVAGNVAHKSSPERRFQIAPNESV